MLMRTEGHRIQSLRLAATQGREDQTIQGQTQRAAEEISKQSGQRTTSDTRISHLTMPLIQDMPSLAFQANTETPTSPWSKQTLM